MTGETNGRGSVVLVADDDEAFAETVKIWLEPELTVRLAHDGDEARRAYGPAVDAVLLDRRMPTLSGDEALEAIHEQEGDAGIAVLTAISPDETILDLDVDLYLRKPVTKEQVLETVETLFERSQYTETVRTLFGLRSKLDAVRATRPEERLVERDYYQRLEAEFDRVYERVSRNVADLDHAERRAVDRLLDDSA